MLNPSNPFDTNYCQYRTPCNYCSRLSKECEFCGSKKKTVSNSPQNSKTDNLNVHGKYVVKFAENHGISTSEAHNHPMVKAHLESCIANDLLDKTTY